MNQYERNRIEQTDRYINARQNDAHPNDETAASLPQRPEPEGVLIDALLNLATASQPDPLFVNEFAQRLRHMAAAKTIRTPWYQRFPRLTHPRVRLAAVSFTVLSILLATLLISVPTAQATIWAWLYGFGLIDQAKVEQQPMPVVNPVIPVDRQPTMSLAEVRQRAPFAVPLPSWLPDHVQFAGGFVVTTTKGAQVSLIYHAPLGPTQTPTSISPLLLLVLTRGAIDGLPLLAAQQQQQTQVHGQMALYTHGSWRGVGQDSQNPALAQLTWDGALDATWLSWHAGDLTFLLYSEELGLRVDDMVRIAESLQ